MRDCVFCRIAMKDHPAVMLYEDDDILAFLDRSPVRRGHTQVIPKEHFETFELLPAKLAARIMILGQHLAGRMREVYGVERVAFVYTGWHIPHAHAHLIPMHENADVMSARYLIDPTPPRLNSKHLRTTREEWLAVRDELGPLDPEFP